MSQFLTASIAASTLLSAIYGVRVIVATVRGTAPPYPATVLLWSLILPTSATLAAAMIKGVLVDPRELAVVSVICAGATAAVAGFAERWKSAQTVSLLFAVVLPVSLVLSDWHFPS